MADITLKGKPIKTVGRLPQVGSRAHDFTLVDQDLKEIHLSNFGGKKKLLNIFPSLDTEVCAESVRTFNEKIKAHNDVVLIHISKDLPFAQGRFCKAEHIDTVALSAFRSRFGRDYGLEIESGPLTGLLSRAVIVLDEHNTVVYTEQVPEISQEPDFHKAIKALSQR